MLVTEKQFESLISKEENEIVEFKGNWFNKEELGEYISALSNSAALLRTNEAYFIWGVKNSNHEIEGTNFNYDKDYDNEPLKHFLARGLTPSINFTFEELRIKGKRVVVLTIPAAKNTITEFQKERFIRIGSSKESLRKYPTYEAKLWSVLLEKKYSLITDLSPNQNLSFSTLKILFAENKIHFTDDNFLQNNKLLTKTGEFNYLAFLLSDQCDVSIKVVKFSGSTKKSDFVFRKEFTNKCILISMDSLRTYIESINAVRSYFDDGALKRRDEFLIDSQSFKEAWQNAIQHNDWSTHTGPAVYLFDDHLEIFSYGSPLSIQSEKDFLKGTSVPVNPELTLIMSKVDKTEQSGKGINTITRRYSNKVFDFSSQTSFTVSLPYNPLAMDEHNFEDVTSGDLNEPVNEPVNRNEPVNEPKNEPVNRSEPVNNSKNEPVNKHLKMNARLDLALNILKARPTIRLASLSDELHCSKATTKRIIETLKEKGKIKRVGSDKKGQWIVL